MRSRLSILLAVVAMLIASPALSSDIPWMSDIDAAIRVAQQSNRLVLVHFYTDSCPPCKRLESVVYSQPGVGRQITENFVPVKINAEHNMKVAQQLGVDRWPTDVILDASGKFLARQSCPINQTVYLGKLAQAAQYLGPAAAPGIQVASRPGSTVPSPYGPPQQQTAAYPHNPPPVVQSKPQPAPVSPSAYSPYQPPSGGSPSPGVPPSYQPAPYSPTPSAAITPPPAYKPAPSPPVTTTPPAYKPAPSPVVTPPPAYKPAPYQPAPTPPRSAAPPSYQQPAPRNPQLQPQPGIPPAAQPYGARPPVTPPPRNSVPPNPRQATPPSQPSSFALDGNCPVELATREQWVRGDKRFGAVHRGQTYLFAGADQQRRFLASPDVYAPAISGLDPVLAFDHGQKVAGSRRHGLTLGDGPNRRVYLFASEETLARFCSDKGRYMSAVRTAEAGQRQPLRR